MENPEKCSRCGRLVPPGRVQCPCGLPRRRYWLHSRETVLFLSVIVLVVGFLITAFVARLYHAERAKMARSWFDRASYELARGKPANAVADLRTSLIYAHGNLPEVQQTGYQLNFAKALASTGSTEEASSYLLDLWEQFPGDSQINLELARLAVRTGDDAGAKRYYNGAIYGVWDEDASQILRSRFDTRLELYRYLVSQGENTAAQSVLLEMAASSPSELPLKIETGTLMLSAGESQNALNQFREALKLDPRSYEALAGAGEAAFHMYDDTDAVRYLSAALRQQAQRQGTVSPSEQAGETPSGQAPPAEGNSRDDQLKRDLAVAQASLALDPYRLGLSQEERAMRAAKAFTPVFAQLEDCMKQKGMPLPSPARRLSRQETANAAKASTSDLTLLYERALRLKPNLQDDNVGMSTERVDSAVNLIFQMETAASQTCGPSPDPTNVAVGRIAQRVEGLRP